MSSTIRLNAQVELAIKINLYVLKQIKLDPTFCVFANFRVIGQHCELQSMATIPHVIPT